MAKGRKGQGGRRVPQQNRRVAARAIRFPLQREDSSREAAASTHLPNRFFPLNNCPALSPLRGWDQTSTGD
jgi:hypothetical protein